MIKERLEKLRAVMEREGIDAYLILTQDFHGSEYVGDFFKCRKYMSGFTGSAGSLVVMKDMAGLWTDGRYFLQAEQELKNTGITLFKMQEEGVPPLLNHLFSPSLFHSIFQTFINHDAAFHNLLRKQCPRHQFQLAIGLIHAPQIRIISVDCYNNIFITFHIPAPF